MRKDHPIQDVMRAGGWSDAKALSRAYTQTDAATVTKLMGA
jgi:hypothetical protein